MSGVIHPTDIDADAQKRIANAKACIRAINYVLECIRRQKNLLKTEEEEELLVKMKDEFKTYSENSPNLHERVGNILTIAKMCIPLVKESIALSSIIAKCCEVFTAFPSLYG
jgi:hypothetical protein